MAHDLSGTWRLQRLAEDGGGKPVETDDGLFALDINNDGSIGANGWKKKKNAGDPGQDVDVKIKSNGNKHQIVVMVTTTIGVKTKYIGTVSDELSGGGKTVLVGLFDDNFKDGGEKRVREELTFGQDDGTWTGVRP